MEKYKKWIYIFLLSFILILLSFLYAYFSTYNKLKKWSDNYQSRYGNFQFKFEFSHFVIYQEFASNEFDGEKTYFLTYAFKYSFNHLGQRVTRYAIHPIFSFKSVDVILIKKNGLCIELW